MEILTVSVPRTVYDAHFATSGCDPRSVQPRYGGAKDF